ncbi:hypothetical protein [Marinobacter sp.]|jgi:ABC-type transport system involved in Fe-S cluster assembly fused permease/ATPase subunit|uniref:hypothetical protein n=1 Tax=Marinobacter sp. TaxID=50741 RepID=UPI003F95010A
MLIVLIVSASLGSFFYYVMLDGLMIGRLERSWAIWSRCVLASALLISVSVTIVAHYFGANANFWHIFSVWPLIALVLHAGYWVIVSTGQRKVKSEVQDAE